MALQREVWVTCDVCDAPSQDVGYGTSTAAEAREHARSAEWHRTNGRDVCAECWEAGER